MEWLPIEEAPKDGRPLLLKYDNCVGMRRYSVRSWRKGGWGNITEGWADEYMQLRGDSPTHYAIIKLDEFDDFSN